MTYTILAVLPDTAVIARNDLGEVGTLDGDGHFTAKPKSFFAAATQKHGYQVLKEPLLVQPAELAATLQKLLYPA
jgi:hypothetical protein